MKMNVPGTMEDVWGFVQTHQEVSCVVVRTVIP